MRDVSMSFLSLVAATVACPQPVVEFGSMQVPGQEGEGDYRHLFLGKEYIGADFRAGLGVDLVVDVCATGFDSDSIGTVIMTDTLEHVQRPWQALAEVQRILKPGGLVVFTTVMNFPIHSYPHDYWRFTPQGIESLLEPCGVQLGGLAWGRTPPSNSAGYRGVNLPGPLGVHSAIRSGVPSNNNYTSAESPVAG